MKQMGDKYFKSDSDQCLPLANQVTYKFSNSISVNISNLIPAIKFKLEHIFTIHLFPLKVETQRNFKLSKRNNATLALQELHKELGEKLGCVGEKTTDAELDDAYELVMMARTDNKVWKSGLDSSYKTFVANKPSPSPKAVLLSIL